ncbi:MAG: type II toxin-antitoxin system Phd/YefM family antitoxin [Hyphomicrobiales bacterium]|nr:type II toxin-antitoxin system Phd/YefM family antitoxin [Hyphomicrobiales bacterium]
MPELRRWPVQDAKARFSEILEASVRDGPQIVTKRGAETAVLLGIDEWRSLQRAARPSLKDLLLAEEARVELDVPVRGRRRRRPVMTAP